MAKTSRKSSKARKSRKGYSSDEDEGIYTPSVLDSDIDSEMDPIEHDVNYKIQSIQSVPLRELIDFFNDPKMINPSGDPTTNIIDRLRLKCYKVPDKRMHRMFRFIENCRRQKVRLMMTERQQPSSGIMLDFDIYQDDEEDQLTDEIFHILSQKIVDLLMKILDFKGKKETIYIGITRRPKITYNDEKDCFKDGFHMIIPGVKVRKGVKLLLLKKLIENELIDQILSEVEPASITIKGQEYQRTDFLDTMSAHVPVFFIGSSTKKGHSPYNLSCLCVMSRL